MIYDITSFSIIDYPDYLSCIVWLSGCNLRCKYCYNEEIIKSTKANISFSEYKNFLKSRISLLDGVVFSGGECTKSPNLLKYLSLAKELNFKCKIDSNGSNPKVIKSILDNNLADYFAIDFKAPKEKLYELTGLDYFDEFKQTLDLLNNSDVEFEIRTTWHYDLLSVGDIFNMYEFLRKSGYKNKYYLQKFQDYKNLANLKQSSQLIDLSIFNDDFVLRNF